MYLLIFPLLLTRSPRFYAFPFSSRTYLLFDPPKNIVENQEKKVDKTLQTVLPLSLKIAQSNLQGILTKHSPFFFAKFSSGDS